LQLQIIRRVGKYQIHRVLGERVENLDAIALQDLVEGESHRVNYTFGRIQKIWAVYKWLV